MISGTSLTMYKSILYTCVNSVLASIWRANPNNFPNLLCLSEYTNILSISIRLKAKTALSAVLPLWSPFIGGVAAITLFKSHPPISPDAALARLAF